MKANNILKAFLTLCMVGLMVFTSCKDDITTVDYVSGIKLVGGEGNSISLVEEYTAQVKVAAYPEDAWDRSQYTYYTYESSNTDIFTVDANGLVSGLYPGQAVLTVTSKHNKDIALKCAVKVLPQVAEKMHLALDISSFQVGIDDTQNIAFLFDLSPANTRDKTIVYTSSNENVVTVDKEGTITGVGSGSATISVYPASAPSLKMEFPVTSGIWSDEFNELPYTDWTGETSHQPTPEGNWGNLFDNNYSSFLPLVKPGNEYDGIAVGSDETVWFSIDMQKPEKFSAVSLSHRNFATRLRVHAISVYGSLDNEEYFPLGVNIDVQTEPQSFITANLPLLGEFEYRYLKITLDKWESAGSSLQITEFRVGTMSFE